MSKWNEENVKTLVDTVGEDTAIQVSADAVRDLADELDFTTNSVAAKLRKMGYTVESMAKVKGKTFTEDEADALEEFVTDNSGSYTYTEIAEVFLDGKFTARQVQGKLLSMDLTSHVKPTPKVEVEKKFSEEEETVLLRMVYEGSFVEDIAAKLGKEIKSVRGKILSLYRDHPDITMPKQKQSYAKINGKDALENLDNIDELTVAQIAEAIGKTERGVKTMLTHRGLTCKDYNGSKKREKIDSSKEAAA